MDRARSSTRPSTRRFLRASTLGVAGLAALSVLLPACARELDTRRVLPKRGTVGEEMYGVLCDRLAAQALHEDLTGASFRDVCHRTKGGEFTDTVDQSALPPLDPAAVDEDGNPVSLDEQRADRDRAVGRIEAFARRRDDLIRALDATFPEQKVGIKDLDNPDETKSCDAPDGKSEGLLTEQLADMLGRMGDLYNDGTIPQSTESLGRVVQAFQSSDEAQAAWARISARQGYRPIATALGAMRPVVAYPHLRDLANASLRLLSADSQPYQLDPKRDENGVRIPVPGPGNAALNQMLAAAHEELLATTVDPPLEALAVKTDPATGRVVLSRPRDNLEMMGEIFYATDPSFGGGEPTYIVKRDPRGYAAISGGAVPAPFVDKNKDGLPDVDDQGRFLTKDGSLAPSPFPFPGSPDVPRDELGRALAGDRLLYEYIDTSHTFAARLMTDLKPLVNPDPEAGHETLMDTLGGVYVMLGPHDKAQKAYPNGDVVSYEGVNVGASPMLDLVYAVGVIMSDRTTDTTLGLARDLFANHEHDVARLSGSLSKAFDIAQEHPEAHIPKEATFWDESLDTMAKIAREPGLLEDVLRALADPDTAQLGIVFSRYATFKDEVTYDKNDINGPPFNLTTNSKSEMDTPVDREQPETGKNRSAMYRFLQLISDTVGVTACNKQGAKVHTLGITIPGSFDECEVFKIDNLGAFYVDAIANAASLRPTENPQPGTIYLRPGLFHTTPGISLSDEIESSSGIQGTWLPGTDTVAPKPKFLNRLVFFDQANDNVNTDTKTFVADLNGPYIGTNRCPERVIDDPMPDAPDASPDGKIHGLRNCPDGQWLQQRNKNTIFTLENFGFYDAIRPLLSAFVKHGREDLFLELASAMYKHWPGAEASPDECRLEDGKMCPHTGIDTYEPLIAEAFATDVLPSLSELARVLDTLPVTRCDGVGANGMCTDPVTISGIDAVAAATRSMLDPDYARTTLRLTDRAGNKTAKRNDGSENPQVTPAYLLTGALSAIDDAFDAYEAAHPEDKARRQNWRRARSQLVDQFLGTTGIGPNAHFSNPAIPKMAPKLVDLIRAQLFAHCPKSFSPPYATCTWAREELTQKATESMAGPLFASGVAMMDAIRADPEGKRQLELLMQYLLDAASKNDALASLLASANDMVQVMRDEENVVPLMHVMAAAMDASVTDGKGHVLKKSLVDAQMALLAKLSGRYFDKDGHEICKREIDPNQILTVALGHLVTPIDDEDFKGQTPLEVIIDVIADVNRVDPTQPYEGTLAKEDYANVSANVVDFLLNKERGLEQFYEVIRQGTKF